jgi:hypothetical protein
MRATITRRLLWLSAIERSDLRAAEQLLALVYGKLRRQAAQKLAHENPGQTLQATALVHEAYLRLVDNDQARSRDSRGHFFAAVAEAMRRILSSTTFDLASFGAFGLLRSTSRPKTVIVSLGSNILRGATTDLHAIQSSGRIGTLSKVRLR